MGLSCAPQFEQNFQSPTGLPQLLQKFMLDPVGGWKSLLSKAFPSASKSLAEQVPPRPLDGKFLWAVAGAVNANAVGSARQSATAADAPLSFDHISSIGRYENAESLRRVQLY